MKHVFINEDSVSVYSNLQLVFIALNITQKNQTNKWPQQGSCLMPVFCRGSTWNMS